MSTVVTRVVPPSRLSQLIRVPGGLTFAEALARAEANVAELAPAALSELDAALQRLGEAGDRLAAAPSDPDALEGCYREGVRIADLAPVARQVEVGEAALSLCDLADRFRHGGRFNAASLQVHLTALRRLRLPLAGDEAGRRAMLDGLKQVVQAA